MNKRIQLICVWSAVLMGPCAAIGWWLLAEFIPPPSPASSAVEIAAMFQQNTNGIRAGMILLLTASGLFLPFVAVISAQIRRIEGDQPVLALTQLMSGLLGVIIIMFAAILWSVAAFRPDRDPQLTQLVNDMAWFVIALPFPTIVFQALPIGVAILSDKSPTPIFPRWLGYLNFWLIFLSLPAGLMTFFKTGPFAWNGLLAFWLPLVIFGVWFNAMIVMMFKAIKKQPEMNVPQ